MAGKEETLLEQLARIPFFWAWLRSYVTDSPPRSPHPTPESLPPALEVPQCMAASHSSIISSVWGLVSSSSLLGFTVHSFIPSFMPGKLTSQGHVNRQ